METIYYKDGEITVTTIPKTRYISACIMLEAFKPMCPPRRRYLNVGATDKEIKKCAKSLYNSIRTVCG